MARTNFKDKEAEAIYQHGSGNPKFKKMPEKKKGAKKGSK